MKIFGREPTLLLQGLQAVLTFVVTFGMPWLNDQHAGAIVAVGAAVLTAINAWAVKPVAPAVFTGLITAGAALLAAYGLDLPQEQVGALSLAVTAVMAFLLREQVTPEQDPQPGGGVPEVIAGPSTGTSRL